MERRHKVKFAVIGYGMIGTRHAQHIANNSRAELVAICDVDKVKADTGAEKYGCKAVYDYNKILSMDVDVVNICTPSGLHCEMSIAALEHGKHVLCEKPIALNLMDSDRVVQAELKSGKKLMLVKQNRYNPPIAVLKKIVDEKKLGKIVIIHSDVIWNRNQQYYDQAYWRGTMALDGGSLMTQCSHFMDLMVWLGGPVKSIFSQMKNVAHPYIETEDVGFITLVFENGAIGSLQYTTAAYNKNVEGSMTVIGTEGNVKIGGQYLNTLEYWDVKDVEKPVLEKGAEANDYGTYKGSMSNHDKVIENVVAVILDGAQIKTTALEGREGLEIMQAAYLSAIEHKEIHLPLRGADYKFKLDDEPPFSGRKKHDAGI